MSNINRLNPGQPGVNVAELHQGLTAQASSKPAAIVQKVEGPAEKSLTFKHSAKAVQQAHGGFFGGQVRSQSKASDHQLLSDSDVNRLDRSIDVTTPDSLRVRTRSLGHLMPGGLQAAHQILRPSSVSQTNPRASTEPLKAVFSLGEDPTVLESSQSLAQKPGYVRLQTDELGQLGARDKLTLVGHGKENSFGGKSPEALADLIQAAGITSLNKISLKGCHSDQYAIDLFNALQSRGIQVQSITGRTDAVVIAANGRTLVEHDGQLFHQAQGSKLEVSGMGVKDVYAQQSVASVRQKSLALEGLGHSGKLGLVEEKQKFDTKLSLLSQEEDLLTKTETQGEHQVPSIQDSLSELKRTGRLTEAVYSTLAQLADEATTLKDPLGSKAERIKLIRSTLQNIAFPQTISQHDRGSCAATVAEMTLAIKKPEAYIQLVTELASDAGISGNLKRFPGTESDDGSKRSVASRLVQTAFMLFARDQDYDNKPDSAGLNQNQSKKLYDEILHSDAYTFETRNWSNPKEGSESLLKNLLAQVTQHPVEVSLSWETGHHAVLLTKMDQQNAYILNPHGKTQKIPLSDFAVLLEGVGYTFHSKLAGLSQELLSQEENNQPVGLPEPQLNYQDVEPKVLEKSLTKAINKQDLSSDFEEIKRLFGMRNLDLPPKILDAFTKDIDSCSEFKESAHVLKELLGNAKSHLTKNKSTLSKDDVQIFIEAFSEKAKIAGEVRDNAFFGSVLPDVLKDLTHEVGKKSLNFDIEFVDVPGIVDKKKSFEAYKLISDFLEKLPQVSKQNEIDQIAEALANLTW